MPTATASESRDLRSPYAKTGTIDNTTYDFTSVLKFIEDNWSLAPLTGRDATANSIADALDLTRTPAPGLPGADLSDASLVGHHNRPLC